MNELLKVLILTFLSNLLLIGSFLIFLFWLTKEDYHKNKWGGKK